MALSGPRRRYARVGRAWVLASETYRAARFHKEREKAKFLRRGANLFSSRIPRPRLRPRHPRSFTQSCFLALALGLSPHRCNPSRMLRAPPVCLVLAPYSPSSSTASPLALARAFTRQSGHGLFAFVYVYGTAGGYHIARGTLSASILHRGDRQEPDRLERANMDRGTVLSDYTADVRRVGETKGELENQKWLNGSTPLPSRPLTPRTIEAISLRRISLWH